MKSLLFRFDARMDNHADLDTKRQDSTSSAAGRQIYRELARWDETG